jgi:hypothetical protein
MKGHYIDYDGDNFRWARTDTTIILLEGIKPIADLNVKPPYLVANISDALTKTSHRGKRFCEPHVFHYQSHAGSGIFTIKRFFSAIEKRHVSIEELMPAFTNT